MTAGYSGTPLVRKLAIKPGMRVLPLNAPRDYTDVVPDLPADIRLLDPDADAADIVHLFITQRAGLDDQLVALRSVIHPAGAIWVSWPKKASGVPTDVTDDLIREAALRSGLVDTKVCAVDEVWSGLKLVVRVKDRG